MRHILYLIICIFLISCMGEQKREIKLRPAKGGKFYGGTFRTNEEEYFKTLYPLNVTEVVAHRIGEQIFEGLTTFDDSSLAVIPHLATHWDIDPSNTKYTFYLRKGIMFHDDKCFPNGKGREMKAKDVKYCFDRICYHNPAENQGFWIFKDVVKGANEYDSLTAKGIVPDSGVSGIKIIDDYTIQIELERPYAVFLARLALIFGKIYPHEAIEKYGSEIRNHPVGTGPFYLKINRQDQVTFLARNPNYWRKDEFGNQLPYLDALRISYIKEKKNELLEFSKGNSDLVYRFPLEMIDEIVDYKKNLKPAYKGYILQYKPQIALQYYGFQHQGKIFNNKDVRKAFCYAIDRQKLCDFTLKGTGFPAFYGTVPPGTGTFDSKTVHGYSFQPSKAQEYMAKAGFPKGKGFPDITLELNSGGARNAQVAEALKKMLEENLGIHVNLLIVPWAQHTEAVETAKIDFYRLGWVADYPDAESFLNLFHSKYVPNDINVKTYINSFRYKNKTFDAIFDKALATIDEQKRNELYTQADQIVIDDAVLLPIYYDIDFRLLQPYVRNCPQNASEQRDFTEVYFVPRETKK
ncbi:MAG TPA: ABC transporter substrate-binding protein [Chitinophagales bacterium]|jgi:oligopeptide transport system substrate-binding protein|nr:ABC transporter substrate-binding protein [Chitinophagales bacterium]HQV76990.1 ABC transporter substrate-binding protein [Chitinophagales bacterium]HQW77943.1 ABC transporter substrate-binding protein [Chitinophagales bacterium]HRB19355.1 ABC transporter substrate-binding protein [Chitinophagales bacterium]